MENKKRILWLDYVRVIAILCVLITHTTERVYTLNAMTLAQESVYSRILSVFMFTVGRLGVPLFLFLTGFLMSGRDYEYERTITFEKRNVLGLVITTEIWIVIYNCFNAWYYQTPLNGKIMIENMLFFRPTEMSHMWYMPVIIGIYLFIPFIINGLNHTDVRSLFIPLSVAFLALFVIPVVDVFLLANGKSAISSLLDFSFSGGAYGFCIILGCLIRKGVFDRIKTIALILIGAGSFCFTVFMQIYSDMHGVDYNVWYNAATLILADLSIFLLVSRMKFISGKIATNISICAFGIYLVHNPVNLILLRYFEPASRVVRLGVGVLVTFLISWGIVFVGSKIKGVSRILFFIKG